MAPLPWFCLDFLSGPPLGFFVPSHGLLCRLKLFLTSTSPARTLAYRAGEGRPGRKAADFPDRSAATIGPLPRLVRPETREISISLVMKADMLFKIQGDRDDLWDFFGPSLFLNLLSLNPLSDCGWAREVCPKEMLKMKVAPQSLLKTKGQKSAPQSLLKTSWLRCFPYDSMIWKELAVIFAAEVQDGTEDCK